MTSTQEIGAGLETLPLELYDQILCLVLTPDGPGDVTSSQNRILRRITPGTKPPAQLQINQTTRTATQEAYYEESTFYFENYRTLQKWLRGLSRRNLGSIRDIRMFSRAKYGLLSVDYERAFISHALHRVLGSGKACDKVSEYLRCA